MKFFLDTANVEQIREAQSLGLIDGVTTNPSLMAKEGLHDTAGFHERIRTICEIVHGPVSAECLSTTADGMVREGQELSALHPDVVVKVPLLQEGLKACRTLRQAGIRVNVTLCFSAVQALLAAKAGATYISPFIGRLDDIGQDGMDLIRDIKTIYTPYAFRTEILVASIRHPVHILEAARIGGDVATMPYEVLEKLIQHPLTDIGQARFLRDWESQRPRPAEASPRPSGRRPRPAHAQTTG